VEDLLRALEGSPTDLARFVKAVANRAPAHIVIPTAAFRGWQDRDPEAWSKVSAWLAIRGTTVIKG